MAEFNFTTGDVLMDNGRIITATRENTSLFTYYASLAVHNHVLIEDFDAADGEPEDYFILASDPTYRSLRKYIEDNGFPRCLDLIAIDEDFANLLMEQQFAAMA